MADVVCNIAAGRGNEFWRRVVANDPTNSALVLVLLKTGDTDDNYRDFDTLAALLAGASEECDFTNYARQVFTDADLSNPTVDDTNNRQDASITQKTISSAGGATNNTIVRGVVCYDPDSTGGTDSDIIPIGVYDASVTTNGQDLVISAGIVYRATSR